MTSRRDFVLMAGANYVAGRNCANCLQFQGKGADGWGVCPAVGGRLVAAKGWCAAWGAKS